MATLDIDRMEKGSDSAKTDFAVKGVSSEFSQKFDSIFGSLTSIKIDKNPIAFSNELEPSSSNKTKIDGFEQLQSETRQLAKDEDDKKFKRPQSVKQNVKHTPITWDNKSDGNGSGRQSNDQKREQNERKRDFLNTSQRRHSPKFARGHKNWQPGGSYVKYSLEDTDATGKYTGLHGDKLNSQVAFDFLRHLKSRNSTECSEPNNSEDTSGVGLKFVPPMSKDRQSASQNLSKSHDGKVVMPEYNFGSRVNFARKPIRKVVLDADDDDAVDSESQSSSKTAMSCGIALSHLDYDDEDE